MKSILLVLFSLFTFSAFGQNYSTINFVTNKVLNKLSFTLFLNEKMVGTLNDDENLEYKMYSEGRISVTILITGGARYTKTIDVKNGSTYYFELTCAIGKTKTELIDEEKGKELFAKNKTTLKDEEDRKSPIGKISSSANDEGPKQGTCFVLNKQGYLLTNYHVISGAKSIQVKGIGNDFSTLYGADVISYDVDLDFAILKLKNQNIVFDNIPYQISDLVNAQGTKSFVLGYPMTSAMGEEIKITEGIINAKSGFKGSISQYQFSATVQPGNSGSPLFNESGDVIGVINAKLQGAENAGYAVKSPYLATFLRLAENAPMEKTTASLASLSLTDKIEKLKGFIFIVKTE